MNSPPKPARVVAPVLADPHDVFHVFKSLLRTAMDTQALRLESSGRRAAVYLGADRERPLIDMAEDGPALALRVHAPTGTVTLRVARVEDLYAHQATLLGAVQARAARLRESGGESP